VNSPRVVTWVAPVVYAAVLVAGLFSASPRHVGWFLGGIAALVGLELLEALGFRHGPPRWVAVALLAARTALFVVVAVADASGVARAMFVLIPFGAYFVFGAAVSISLGAALLAFASLGQNLADTMMYGLGLALAIAMAAVAEGERRARAQVAELSAAAERQRLARDLHDSLGHHLTTIAVLLEKAQAFRSVDATVADAALGDARESARQALEDVRQSVRALDDRHLRFGPALRRLAGDALPVRVTGDETGFGQNALHALYRAAQEGITNARRHSGATEIAVSVEFGQSSARLEVSDNGRGLSGAVEGFGLRGLRERVELAGGSLSLAGDTDTRAGTRLTVEIPR